MRKRIVFAVSVLAALSLTWPAMAETAGCWAGGRVGPQKLKIQISMPYFETSDGEAKAALTFRSMITRPRKFDPEKLYCVVGRAADLRAVERRWTVNYNDYLDVPEAKIKLTDSPTQVDAALDRAIAAAKRRGPDR